MYTYICIYTYIYIYIYIYIDIYMCVYIDIYINAVNVDHLQDGLKLGLYSKSCLRKCICI
jgi:hypothetical protein